MSTALVPFGPDIWIADGPVIDFYGFPYPTRMAVIRLKTDALLVWSPVLLTPEIRSAVGELGRVIYLVSPNALHHLYLSEWKSAYPTASIYGSPALAKKRPDLHLAILSDDDKPGAWDAEIDFVVLAGSFALTETAFFHRRSQTALFADIIQNFSPTWFRGWRGWLARMDGIVAPHPGAPREWRLTFLRREKARTALHRVQSWPTERVIVAHGELVSEDAAMFVERSLRWLA